MKQGIGFTGLARNADYLDHLERDCLPKPQVFIEITSRCNYSCFYCPSREFNRNSTMSDDLFYRIVDQIGNMTASPINLHCDGEPTLHPRFLEYAGAITDRGLRLGLVTNGSRLSEEHLALPMGISVNLSTNEAEFAGRSNTSFEEYIRRLQDYVKAWRDGGHKQTILYKIYFSRRQKRSESALANAVAFVNEFLAGMGFAERVAEDAAFGSTWVKLKNRSGHVFLIKALGLASGGLYPATDDVEAPRLPREHGFCDSPWKRLVILADGRIQPCCIDLSGSLSFTDPIEIHNSSLRDLWMSHPRIQSMRNDLIEGRVTHPTCRRCLDRLPGREFYIPSVARYEGTPTTDHPDRSHTTGQSSS